MESGATLSGMIPRDSVARGAVRNSEGVQGADVWGKRARWVHYYGPVEGAPSLAELEERRAA